MSDIPTILDEQLADEIVIKNTPMMIEMVDVASLNPAAYNPRKMMQENFENLQRGLDRFDMVQPIVVNKRNMVIVGGHQRWAAAKAFGWTQVPVIFRDLNDADEKLLNVQLNSPKFSGEFDLDQLSELLHDFDDEALLESGYIDELDTLQDGYINLEAVESSEESKPTKAPSFTIAELLGRLNTFKEATGSTDAVAFLQWLG